MPRFNARPVTSALVLALFGFSCGSTSTANVGSPIVFPEPPDPPRIQFLRSVAKGADVEAGRSALDTLLFGKREEGSKEIPKPFGCAFRDGIVYLTDTGVGAILTIDLAAGKLGHIPLRGRARPQKPMAICFAEDGHAFIADSARRKILVLDKDFKWVKDIGPFEGKSAVTDVKVIGDRIYAVDARATCLRVLDRKTGKEVLQLGNALDRRQSMRGPTSVAVDDNGHMYVTDSIYCRIFVWDRDGKFVRTIGSPGDVVGQFGRPKGIAYSNRTLFVLDSSFENCQILDLNGRPLMFFGGPGTGPGTFYMPATIWIGEEGLELFKDRIAPDFVAKKLIIVTSQFGPNKVSFFAFGRSKSFDYPESDLPSRPTRQVAKPESSAQERPVIPIKK